MKKNLASAFELAQKDPNFFNWLHELTTLGYKKNTIINIDHSECIGYLFIMDTEPADALREYIEFKLRYETLQNEID